MDVVADIKNELKGRTGLKEEFEEDLFRRIAQVESDLENHGSIVPTLKKQDFYAAVILILAGVGTIIVSAFII
jgi:hypothetical protein